MLKLKLYLDTSVISHLEAPDVPDKEADTLKLWEYIKSGRYEMYVSPVVFEEINECKEPKKSRLLDFLEEVDFILIEENDETQRIAQKLIDNGTLTEKSLNDCRQIACALFSACDMITSWNFNHIVNIKTINGVKAISALEGYREISIYAPNVLVGGEHND
jgi:predicted nucleic acid-binding protein